MRVEASAYQSADNERQVSVFLYRGSSVGDVLDGNPAETVDISEFTTKVSMSESSMSLSISYNTEFISCADQLKVGEITSIVVDGVIRFIGIISNIDAFYEERGERRIDITARTRDGVGGWKNIRAVSKVYPLGSNLSTILEQVSQDLMALKPSEYKYPSISYTVPHSNSQFTDETPWSMITTVLEAANYVPYVNVLNQVTAYSKTILGATTIKVKTDRLISKGGTSQNITYSKVRLRWLDATLKETAQQDQLLYSTAMTAGYFQRKQEEDTWWSADHRQRARNTYMKIRQSVNSGLVSVADEKYRVIDEYHGQIVLTTRAWVPTLLVMANVTLIALSYQPDVAPQAPSGFLNTISVGRVAEAAMQVSILVTMMSMGVGSYEIWGVLFDYVHAKNTTVAYVSNQPAWVMQELEMENDLILGETHAQSVAVTSLVFENAKSASTSVEMVDDPRIEVGDILEFEDNTKMFVTGFSNDFSRGSPATIKVNGLIV